MADADAQKRLKALNKKLGQIGKLKEKAQLTQEEKEKVDSEPAILSEIRELENGKPLHEVKAQQEAAKAPSPAKSDKADIVALPQNEGAAPHELCETEPTRQGEAAAEAPAEVQQEEGAGEATEMQQLEPAEAEKRIKALKKKLAQIEKLKEKDNLSAEEAEKVARQAGFEAEIQEIEIGLLDPETKKNAVNLQRKLDQIRKLKEKGGQLNAQERDKVSKAPALLKELQNILGNRPTDSRKAGH